MEENGHNTSKDATSDNSDTKSAATAPVGGSLGGGGGGRGGPASLAGGASSVAEGHHNGGSHHHHHHNHHKSPKKRRKVNHACVYCRRSERPCTRCIKRNIGHLCHDEPRDQDSKKTRSVQGTSVMDESDTRSEVARSTADQTRAAALRALEHQQSQQSQQSQQFARSAGLSQGNPLSQLVSPTQGIQAGALNSNLNQFAGFNDAWLNNPFHDMHTYHPNYMIPEVSHEFNLLNDFLHSSLLDDGGAISPEESNHPFKSNSGPQHSNNANSNTQRSGGDMVSGGYLGGTGAGGSNNNLLSPNPAPGTDTTGSMGPPATTEAGTSIARPSSAAPPAVGDKAREYYLQVADPSGNDVTPEQRMVRLLQAKVDAGLLRPFNYTKGYSRLLTYLDGHVAPSVKQKVLRQLDRFRPKFREKVEKLADIDLVYIEIWFERTLMEYDRVFASMAVPACCWRRTGEIFRGNTEMAELLGIEVDRLRDGKISLHQILTEESVVRYWEEFGTIAFDPDHDSLLTACALKHPDDKINTVTNCCFSFMIRRDDHKLPSLIVGNFLPHDP